MSRISVDASRSRLGSTKLRSLLLFLVVTLLVTASYVVSTLTVAGIPVVLALLGLLLISYRREITSALRAAPLLRLFLLFWLTWLAVTAVRLSIDFPIYGSLALRDAVIAVCFGSVLLGAAVQLSRGGEGLVAPTRGVLLVLAAYSLLYPFRESFPAGVRDLFSIQNVSVSSIALLAAGMWLRGTLFRLVMLSTGLLALFLTQSRTMYLVAVVLLLLFLITQVRSNVRTLGASSRILAAAAVAGVGIATLFVIGESGVLAGRVGAASLGNVVALVGSLFDDTSALAGSRQDRDQWWSDAISLLIASPSNLTFGVGLGPDLANGFVVGGELVRKPHNDYLETAVRFGLPVGIALTLLVAVSLIRVYRAGVEDPLYLVLFAWLLAAAVNALGQPYFSYPHGAIPAGIIIGVALVLPWRRRPPKRERVHPEANLRRTAQGPGPRHSD